jgi:hypothetical protein
MTKQAVVAKKSAASVTKTMSYMAYLGGRVRTARA